MGARSVTVWLSRFATSMITVALLAAGGCMAGAVGASSGSGGAGAAGSGGNAARGGSLGSGGAASRGAGGSSTGAGGSETVMDASAGDGDAACAHLNIGILGNPGSNPSSNFQAWLEARGTTVQRIQTTADVPLTAADLAVFDVVVLDLLTRDYTADEAAVFAAWVSAGGGFASMSGYKDDPTQDWHANSLLAPLGLAYALPRSWGPVTQFAAHPITAGLTSVTFTGGYVISDLGGDTSTRTPIAFLAGTPANVVGSAVQMGAGHGFVWGDEWIEFDSEWSAMPQIPQLWLQVFTWISPPSRCMLTGIGPIT
jgi:hypothetical protein